MTALATVRWAIVFVPFAIALACSREADIVDEIDASITAPPTVTADAEIPPVDTGLETDAFPACSERPVGDCQGTNDFPCAMASWVEETASRCWVETNCEGDGWLNVEMNGEGCVDEIGMQEPHQSLIACLLAELGTHRCPCGESSIQHLFIAAPGCTKPCGSGEFPCPPGLVCNAEAKCVKP